VETLQNDLPDLAEEIVAGSHHDPTLKEALRDYESVCERLDDDGVSPEDRAEWTEIRDELVDELRRLVLRLRQQRERNAP